MEGLATENLSRKIKVFVFYYVFDKKHCLLRNSPLRCKTPPHYVCDTSSEVDADATTRGSESDFDVAKGIHLVRFSYGQFTGLSA